MKNIEFTKCETNDLDILQQISLKTFSDSFQHKNTPANFAQYTSIAFNKKQIKKELENKNSHFFFVFLNKKLAGYLKLNELDAQTERQPDHSLEIERIYLYQQFQGKGFGREMFDFAIDFAKKKNKDRIWLGVWEENTAAIGFYKKLGFSEFGKHVFWLGDDEQIDLMLELNIARIS